MVACVAAARSLMGGVPPLLNWTACVVDVSHNHADVRRMLSPMLGVGGILLYSAGTVTI